MKKFLLILFAILSLNACYTQSKVYRGEVHALYVVTTWLGERYYLVEIKDQDGKFRKMRVQYNEWKQLQTGQEVVIY